MSGLNQSSGVWSAAFEATSIQLFLRDSAMKNGSVNRDLGPQPACAAKTGKKKPDRKWLSKYLSIEAVCLRHTKATKKHQKDHYCSTCLSPCEYDYCYQTKFRENLARETTPLLRLAHGKNASARAGIELLPLSATREGSWGKAGSNLFGWNHEP